MEFNIFFKDYNTSSLIKNAARRSQQGFYEETGLSMALEMTYYGQRAFEISSTFKQLVWTKTFEMSRMSRKSSRRPAIGLWTKSFDEERMIHWCFTTKGLYISFHSWKVTTFELSSKTDILPYNKKYLKRNFRTKVQIW